MILHKTKKNIPITPVTDQNLSSLLLKYFTEFIKMYLLSVFPNLETNYSQWNIHTEDYDQVKGTENAKMDH